MRIRRGVLAAVVALVTLSAGCGLPDDREPRVITATDAPVDLSAGSGGALPASGNTRATLFFVQEGHLVEVQRFVAGDSVQAAVASLLQGPTAAEQDDEIRTVIPGDVILGGDVTIAGSVATLNLSCQADAGAAPPANCGILGVVGPDQVTAFAQLTCTATAMEGITGVLFQQAGQAIPAPRADGGNTEPGQAVACPDYRSLQSTDS